MTKRHQIQSLILLASAVCLLDRTDAAVHADTEQLRGWAMQTGHGHVFTWQRSGSAALSIKTGEAIDPCCEPGDEETQFMAMLRIDKAGRYRFGSEVNGGKSELRIIANSRSLATVATGQNESSAFSNWLELPSGEIGISAFIVRNSMGAVQLRTMWERAADAGGAGFGPEPISSFFVRPHPAADGAIRSSELALEGRVLLQRKGCVQCHDAGPGAIVVSPLEAPRLDHLGLRLNREWVERWIVDPAKLKAGTDMPSLYGSSTGDSAAVANWLCQEKPNTDDAHVANEAFVLERGRKLYHTIGCVACHGAFDKPSELFGEQHADDDALMPPNDFGNLAGKWRLSALSEFLRDPVKTRPNGRMPSLKLSQDESDAISNYLLSKWGTKASDTLPAQMGEVLTLSTCAACHAIEGVKRATTLGKPLANLNLMHGCLDANDKSTPRYALTSHEVDAIRAGIIEVMGALGKPAPLDTTRRQMEFLDCGACHTRDGRGGGSDGTRAYCSTLDEKADLGNEGRIPPDLTGVGFKLTTPWLKKVLAEGARARPYLATRMPVFGAKAIEGLAEGLARTDGVEPNHDATEPTADNNSVQAGRALMGKGALACATCHLFKAFASQGTPGPRIDQFSARLRYEWWSAYMLDPSRYKPGTRMPSFETGGRSACRTILDGDLHKQIDALWSYCNLGDFMPAPEGIDHGRGLQLIVGPKPIVLRTFLESVGPRAIAVGMPSGLHYAFDAQSVRLAEAWRGDFLDASAAWTGRGGENAGGEGPNVWKAAAGCIFAVPPSAEPIVQWPTETGKDAGLKFRGYSIGDDGVPTFEYRWRDFDVTEKVTTTAAPALQIMHEFKLKPAPPVFVVNTGPGENRIYVHVAADLRVSTLDHGIRRFELTTANPQGGCDFTLEINP